MLSRTISVACSLALLQGCAAYTEHRQGSAPWDPPEGRALFEQLPNWDGAAAKICCGHLKECQPHQSPRC